MSNAEVIVLTDDDVELSPDFVLEMVKRVKVGVAVIMIPNEPFTLAIRREDYVKLGGFEERILRYQGDDTEFWWRMIAKGMQIIEHQYPEGPKHLGEMSRAKWSFKELLAAFNHTLAFIRYKNPLWKQRLRQKLFRFFFMQWKGNRGFAGWRAFMHILAFPYWMIRCKVGKRNSFGWSE